jgi:hypothetical protein
MVAAVAQDKKDRKDKEGMEDRQDKEGTEHMVLAKAEETAFYILVEDTMADEWARV